MENAFILEMLAFLFFKMWLVYCLYTLTGMCVTLSEPHSSTWRRDVNFVNTEFQSFLSSSTVRSSSECIHICSSTSQCMFATFNNFTRLCTTYAFLDGPVHVTNTSLWKACLKNGGLPYVHFGHINLNFMQANKFCADFGGHLALPDTYEEMQKVKQILGQKEGVTGCWIGGIKSENGWEWLDGRPIMISSILWSPGEPAGVGKCISLWKYYNYRFDDIHCSYEQQFVCEFNQSLGCV